MLYILLGMLYSTLLGLILVRYSCFVGLRNEAIRIIQAINYMTDDNEKVKMWYNTNDVNRIPLIAADFHRLIHKPAGDLIYEMAKDLSELIMKEKTNKVTIDQCTKFDVAYQSKIRKLRFNLWKGTYLDIKRRFKKET